MAWLRRSQRPDGEVAEDDLKLCALCSSLNLISNTHCFVCGWHGVFSRDTVHLTEAMVKFESERGRIEVDLVTDPQKRHGLLKLEQRGGIREWFAQARQWLFG